MPATNNSLYLRKTHLDIPKIIKNQRSYFRTEATKDIKFRKSLLKSLRSEVQLRENEIYDVLKKDFRKPTFESYLSELGIVLSDIDLAIKHLDRWAKPKRVRPSLLNFPSSDYIYSEPYGIVLIIAPWNYPFQLAISPVVAAIAAGNTVVLKPSELTLHTSNLVQDILSKIFEPSHVSVVQGGVSVATELLAKRWDYIFFTGSVPVGKIVAKAAAQHLTPVTLELGGKSPCIIDENVNIKLVVRRLVWGKFLNAGQTCIAPDYLIVHSKIKTDFIEALKNKITSVYGDDPEQSSDLARIVNGRNLDRLTKNIENETIIYGGQVNKETNYLAPTLIDEPDLQSDLMEDEIFGPILPILSYDNENDIDKIVMTFEKPLSFYVFTNNKKFSKRMIKRFSFGGGVINDTLIHFGNQRLPFGGVGASGIGAYHGRYGFDTFSHQKAVVRKANWLDIPVRYAPYKGKLKALKSLFKWMS